MTRNRHEAGSALIEFALALPVLLLVMCGIFDFGFLFQRYEVLTNAAREGARMAALPGYTEDQVKSRVDAYLNAGGVPGTAVTTMAYESVVAGTRRFNIVRVTVTYTYQYSFIGPFMSLFGSSLSSVPVKAVAVMRVESQGG